MKIIKNIEQILKTLDGKELTMGENLSDVAKVNIMISNILVNQQQTDNPVRAFNLANKLYNVKKEIEVEDSDYELMVKAVKENKQLSVLVAGQLLGILETAEEKKV